MAFWPADQRPAAPLPTPRAAAAAGLMGAFTSGDVRLVLDTNTSVSGLLALAGVQLWKVPIPMG